MDISTNVHMVGGVVGYANGGTLSNVVSRVKITVSANMASHLGGVVGYTNTGGKILNCLNLGKVEADAAHAYVGGILGYVNNTGATVQNCFGYGSVGHQEGTSEYTGMVIGYLKNGAANKIGNNYFCSTEAFPSGCGSGGKNMGVTGLSAAECASGKAAYLLNNSVTDGTQAWYQNLDNGNEQDACPTLTKNSGNTVYKVEDDVYSNKNAVRVASVLQLKDLRTYQRNKGQTILGFGKIDDETKKSRFM